MMLYVYDIPLLGICVTPEKDNDRYPEYEFDDIYSLVKNLPYGLIALVKWSKNMTFNKVEAQLISDIIAINMMESVYFEDIVAETRTMFRESETLDDVQAFMNPCIKEIRKTGRSVIITIDIGDFGFKHINPQLNIYKTDIDIEQAFLAGDMIDMEDFKILNH